jgi:hypothetical protein
VLKKLSIAFAAAAVSAALVAAASWPGAAQQRSARAQSSETAIAPVPEQRHDAGMRIIHVPQGGTAVATAPDEMIDDEPLPQPKLHKRAVRRVLPPAGSSKRTVLNAPADKALTPVYPTPRWRGIEKFTEPPPPVTSTPAAEQAPISDDTPPPAD